MKDAQDRQNTIRRYNVGIQRARGLLELSSGLFDSSIAQLCANDKESPYDVPLHPGGARFYRERGYLK
jgi:hypothetical protein